MAIAIAPIVAALDLSEVVLSGPADLLDGILIDAAIETLHARTLEGVFEDVVVRLTHQEDIVLREPRSWCSPGSWECRDRHLHPHRHDGQRHPMTGADTADRSGRQIRVGLDVGGTKIDAVAVDPSGHIRGRLRRPPDGAMTPSSRAS